MTFQNYCQPLCLFGATKKKNLKETKSLALRAYNKYTVWRGTKDIDIYGERLGNSTIFSPLHVIVSFQLFSLFFFWRSCKIVQWFNLTKVVLCCWEVKVLDTRLEALYSLSNVFYLAPQVGHYLSLETFPTFLPLSFWSFLKCLFPSPILKLWRHLSIGPSSKSLFLIFASLCSLLGHHTALWYLYLSLVSFLSFSYSTPICIFII